MLALSITGGAIATVGYWLVQTDTQEGTVAEIIELSRTERTLHADLLPGSIVSVWWDINKINNCPSDLVIMLEGQLVGIELVKWEIKPSTNGNWVIYNLGDNIGMLDYPDGLTLGLSGIVMGLDNQAEDNIARVSVQLYRAT